MNNTTQALPRVTATTISTKTQINGMFGYLLNQGRVRQMVYPMDHKVNIKDLRDGDYIIINGRGDYEERVFQIEHVSKKHIYMHLRGMYGEKAKEEWYNRQIGQMIKLNRGNLNSYRIGFYRLDEQEATFSILGGELVLKGKEDGQCEETTI